MAALNPRALPSDSRIGEINYEQDQVFQIRTAQGIATHIILDPREKIISSAAGTPADCNRQGSDWCIVALVGANELFVQPRHAGPTSNNLQLTTNLRRYSFEFLGSSAQRTSPWYRVTFRYTPDRNAHLLQSTPQSCNWNYAMSETGDGSYLAPLAVFDDGRNTYLVLPPDAAETDIESATGSEPVRLVSSSAASRLMLLPGIRTSFTMRSSLSRVVVWNEGASTAATSACPIW